MSSTPDAVCPITLGVVLDATTQERWVLESLRQTLAVPGVSVAALAVASAKFRVSLAFRLYGLFDQLDKQVRCREERLFVPVDVAAELAMPVLKFEVLWDDDGWYPDGAGADELRRCDVDIWLCFTAIPPRRQLCSVARVGVWGIEVGQGVAAANVWAGAMEVGAGSPVTMINVVDYADSGNGLLYQSFGATIKNSTRRNRLNVLRKGMSFFRRLLEHLARNADTWKAALPATRGVPRNYPALPAPTVPALFQLTWRLVSNVVANQLRLRYWLDQWQIAYYFAGEDETDYKFERLHYLVPPQDRFWADPIAVEYQGRYFIFYEELPFETGKGRLMTIEVFEDAEPGVAQVALERPYHLSYPFIFGWNGSLYMLPETAENRTVELYRCESFPNRWQLDRILLENIRAFDASLWREKDRWWMFVNVAEAEADSCDELHLYWSATPLGPWTAHRNNPVISDVRCARPAGPLFSRGGVLYRPSQDCSLAYGHSVSFNRIDVLLEEEYQEITVGRIEPEWREDIQCVHTIGGSKRLRVIDCVVRRKRR